MSHGSKPRKPRWIAQTDTMALACRRASLVTEAELQDVMQPLQAAFKAMREGVATEWQWSHLASSVNAALAIERFGVVKGMHEHLRAADLALQGIYRRAMTKCEWHSTPLYYFELDALDTAINLHKFQLTQLSRGEVIRALDYAKAEVLSTGGKVLEVIS